MNDLAYGFRHVVGPIHSSWPGSWLAVRIVTDDLGRPSYAPPWRVLVEVKKALTAESTGAAAWLMLVGAPDPVLHSGLPWIIANLKALSTRRVGVLTPGSLLDRRDVQSELSRADAVVSARPPFRSGGREGALTAYDRLTQDLAKFCAASADRMVWS